ncbi:MULTISPECIES: type IV secretory system conjugative DNA transfer family protein [unclassified Streptomyces]|uniref:type IV secretory system conjugative DNA transfer family protein n=1 Tax=unclassified Streptomyces TaxID=2593676 RepID=UPI000747430E|nr:MULTISPECIES: type IV secretory system conjugative DNA transfer family protein [unclassified Streptomyces]KUL69163.1 type VI secretion protein [Streptomyces sp. NRRL WC-3604]KUL69202.1 type VI secretion protein [Streptomyces sp. NRRL WC-3605]
MRPDDRGERRNGEGQGGVSDGLLIGILGFLLGMTLMVWTATGLAGLFAHGSWPDGVTVSRTPLAMRSLIGDPHDLAGAWPDTPEGQLSGYGLFWGLFIGQLMVLVVLTVFVMGTLARWRAVRAARRAGRPYAPAAPAPHEVPAPRTEPVPAPEPRQTAPAVARQPEPAVEHAAPHTETAALTDTAPHTEKALPVPLLAEPALAPLPTAVTARETLVVAPRDARRHRAAQAVLDAEGPALVVTSDPALWQDTKDARGKLGPVLLYDPAHLCDTPARLHWSPTTGCEDKATAAARAAALLAPVRPTSRLDQAVGDTAETLLRCCLHAAAVDGRTVRHVHRWSQGTQIQDAVRILRTHPKAAAGSAGELEAALTAHPERRDMAQELTTRALAALSTVNVRESCTPYRTDALTLDSFVHETGTLYVVGESIEDPRAEPGAMPLLTALAASVVERGRRMAERSSSGRLDPPMTLVLDDVAAVAPLPQVPELLATGADRGMPTLALLRSREQARSRWPHAELPG